MAATKSRRHPRAGKSKGQNLPFHAFWSGSLTFGLVNVRVLVFPATRHSGVRLRLMSDRGSFLKRRFFCPRDDKELSQDEIVRGFELDDGSYITVTDKELETLEPEKTQEIVLKEFVPLSELPPALLERGYILTPQKEAIKAYRLLAEVMERAERAGIATFVMRDREYLIAIFARSGILCAETLRFHDEIRKPAAVGLPKVQTAPRARVAAFERAIDALSSRAMPPADPFDDDDQKLRTIIGKKVKAGHDLVRVETESREVDQEDESDVDLLETIRQSLRRA